MLLTCCFKYLIAKILSVYPPNASLLKKFPHLPIICPNIKLGAVVSATSQKFNFFILVYTITVMTPAIIPPYIASPPSLNANILSGSSIYNSHENNT